MDFHYYYIYEFEIRKECAAQNIFGLFGRPIYLIKTGKLGEIFENQKFFWKQPFILIKTKNINYGEQYLPE